MRLTEPKLLIADDDRDFRESLGEIFQRRGYLTQFAADGREAVEIVQSSTELHLVLLDMHMPKLTGLQAISQIRQMIACSLPCILMSGKLDEAIVREAHALQTASVLSKPFSLRDITSMVESVLHDSYGWSGHPSL